MQFFVIFALSAYLSLLSFCVIATDLNDPALASISTQDPMNYTEAGRATFQPTDAAHHDEDERIFSVVRTVILHLLDFFYRLCGTRVAKVRPMADHLPRFDVFEPVTEVALKPVVTNSQNTKVPLLDSTHELQIPVGLKQDLDKYVRLQDGIKILTRGGVKNLETLEKVGTETIKSDNVLDKAHSTIAAMFSSLPDSITDRQAVDLYERLETNFGTSRLAGILEIAVHQKGSVSVNKLVDVQFQRLENDNFYDRVLEELTQQFSSDIIDHFKESRSRFMSRGD